MVRRILANLPRGRKNKLRRLYAAGKMRWISAFLSYGEQELLAGFRALGVGDGDSVLLHSASSPTNGFAGSVGAVTDVLTTAIGPGGNLLMVSLPYMSSSHEYLKTLESFDVRKTPSRMGLMSEFFRRRKEVLRSLHPTHPILACGPRAEWIVAGHESIRYPCGPGSPFEKLLELDGKVVFFDAPFAAFTFFHYLEHRHQDRFRFPLYHDRLFDVPVIDREGQKGSVKTFVFSDEVIRRRRFSVLETELKRQGLIARRRVGNTTLLLVRLRSVIDCVDSMMRRGTYFYDVADPIGGVG
jgi:aminoglycoside 3-N-acetyltransferase